MSPPGIGMSTDSKKLATPRQAKKSLTFGIDSSFKEGLGRMRPLM
eukprot:CAMPEP_0178403780 /NCGR_PEP_ID=MMETSP0689_2-20121128/17546_1 /TAXON_ID=160604 /ORGANISM="Amphidinium massartii, Strain CS-259" /LENGTH=44 /DNA_ID= /DNA_START= /DNA_END= /DNA_ORIENTATION=